MAINWGELIGGPIGQFLTAIFSMNQQDQAQGEFDAHSDQQIDDSLRVAGVMGSEPLDAYDVGAQAKLGSLQDVLAATGQSRTDFLRDFGARGENLVQGYEDRYNTALGDLEGYGNQQREDIDTQFRQLSEQAGTNFSNSSVGTTLQQNIERSRGAEQRRLGEQLQGLRLNYLPSLSGQTLAAQGGLDAANAQWDAAMRGQVLNAQGNIGNFYGENAVNRSNLINQGYRDFLNTLTGINLQGPQTNNIPYQAGQNAVQGPQPQGSALGSFTGAAAGGVGAGLAAAWPYTFSFTAGAVCIGEDSVIKTRRGSKTLRQVCVGDWTRNADGKWRKIVAKHFGAYDGDDTLYIRLTMDGISITASRDHVINGRSAEQWIGEPGVEWEPMIPDAAGDLLLDDESDYVANGFVVRSLMGLEHVAVLDVLEPENQLVGVG
jgi:hypothetical protein